MRGYIVAHEAGKPEEFERLFADARAGLAEAATLADANDGVKPFRVGLG